MDFIIFHPISVTSAVKTVRPELLWGFLPHMPPMSRVSGAAAPCEMVLSLVSTTAIGFNIFLSGAMAVGKGLKECRRGIAFSTFSTLAVSTLIMVVGSGSAKVLKEHSGASRGL